MFPQVTPDDVAQFAPEAPAVTELQCEEARDWAEGAFERAAAPVPAADSRAGRALKRALCAYALAVASSGRAGSVRASGEAVEEIRVAQITLKSAEAGETAEGMDLAAGDWLRAAWRHLRAAGLPSPRVAVGAAR